MLSAKENALRLYHHEMPEYQPFMGEGIINNVPVEGYAERAKGGNGKDWFGVNWSKKPEEPAPMPVGPYLMDDVCDWKELIHMPNLDEWDWEEAARVDRIPEFDRDNHMLYQMIHNGIMERFQNLMSYEDALCAMMTDPDECSELFYAIADYKCKLIDKISEYYKPDVICYHDDWGTQKGLLFSPNTWRALLKEPTKQIVEHCHSKGILFELHSDGMVKDLIPEIVDDLKVDGLNIMGINDIPKLKEYTGNRVVYNVFLNTSGLDVRDAIKPLTREEVKDAIREEIRYNAKGGSYIPCILLCRQEWIPWIKEAYEEIKFDVL